MITIKHRRDLKYIKSTSTGPLMISPEFRYCIRCVLLHLLQQPGSTSLITGCYTPLLLKNGQNWLYAPGTYQPKPAEKVKSLKISENHHLSGPLPNRQVLATNQYFLGEYRKNTPETQCSTNQKMCIENGLSLGDFECFT